MKRRNLLVVLAGLLLLVASAMILLSESGYDLGILVELGVGPLIGIAILVFLTGQSRDARPM